MTETDAPNARPVEPTDIALPPEIVTVSQDREWCVVRVNGDWKRIRFHDYAELYEIPGLYEMIFYDVLQCSSPATVGGMLKSYLGEAGVAPRDLRVLDLGAGNGMVGEELAGFGVGHIVGVDIIAAAAMATQRDREGIYERYLVLDMTDASRIESSRLSEHEFNCLTCVAALGFGDIPPAAFANAYNLIEPGGPIAFNIKSDFLQPGESGGFADLIQRMIQGGLLEIRARRQYSHRLSTSGEPLQYTALVGVKERDLPADWTR
jgi:SAM-dependent methyltransferase